MSLTFLGDDWHARRVELGRRLPERPGASAVIEHELSDGPEGTVHYVLELAEGRIAASRTGRVDEPDLTVRQSFDEHRSVVLGELDPNVAYMRGSLKVAGDLGRFLSLLPLVETPEWRELTSTLAAETD